MSTEVELTPVDVEGVVRSVDGVAAVLRTRPDVAAVVGHVRDLLTQHQLADVPRVLIADGVIRVTIATEQSAPAPAVARSVHDAVIARAAQIGVVVERVEVTVASIS